MREISKIRLAVYTVVICFFTVTVLLQQAGAMHERMECSDCHKRAKLDYQLCLQCHDRKMDTSDLNPPYSLNSDIMTSAGSFNYFNYKGHQVYQCLNCHDSHNNDNYRNLKKNISGRQIKVNGIGDPFYQENIYISGMSDFCVACHEASPDHSHPVGVLIINSDNADYDSWAGKTSRISLVEIASGDLNDIAGARVFCMTCHVAHGGPFKNMLRWEGKEGCLECHVKN